MRRTAVNRQGGLRPHEARGPVEADIAQMTNRINDLPGLRTSAAKEKSSEL